MSLCLDKLDGLILIVSNGSEGFQSLLEGVLGILVLLNESFDFLEDFHVVDVGLLEDGQVDDQGLTEVPASWPHHLEHDVVGTWLGIGSDLDWDVQGEVGHTIDLLDLHLDVVDHLGAVLLQAHELAAWLEWVVGVVSELSLNEDGRASSTGDRSRLWAFNDSASVDLVTTATWATVWTVVRWRSVRTTMVSTEWTMMTKWTVSTEWTTVMSTSSSVMTTSSATPWTAWTHTSPVTWSTHAASTVLTPGSHLLSELLAPLFHLLGHLLLIWLSVLITEAHLLHLLLDHLGGPIAAPESLVGCTSGILSTHVLELLTDLLTHLGEEIWWVEGVLGLFLLVFDLILRLFSDFISDRSFVRKTIISKRWETVFLQHLLLGSLSWR